MAVRQECDPPTLCLYGYMSMRFFPVAARARMGDPQRIEHLPCFEETVEPVVEDVVVGQTDHVESAGLKCRGYPGGDGECIGLFSPRDSSGIAQEGCFEVAD